MCASKALKHFLQQDSVRAGFVLLLLLQEEYVRTRLCHVMFGLCISKDLTSAGFEYRGWQWYKYCKYCALPLAALLCLCSCPVSTKLCKSVLLVLAHLLMVVVSGSFVYG